MHGLNRILARPSHLAVLRTLYHADQPLTGRETERRSGLSNRATMMALENLTEIAAVQLEQNGNAYWYTLNTSNYLVAKSIIPSFDAEDLIWDDLRKIVRRVVHPRPIAAVATGPLARDETLSEGRIELTMVFSSGRSRLRAFRTMDALTEALWNRHAVDLEHNLLDINTVDREENDPLWKRVEREGILLFGTLP